MYEEDKPIEEIISNFKQVNSYISPLTTLINYLSNLFTLPERQNKWQKIAAELEGEKEIFIPITIERCELHGLRYIWNDITYTVRMHLLEKTTPIPTVIANQPVLTIISQNQEAS